MSATGRSASAGTGHVRHPDDFYRTPAWCVRAILPHLDMPADADVFDPACGDGAILDAIREALPNAATYGIEIDWDRATLARRHNVRAADALTLGPDWWDVDFIVMNPPFRHAEAFVRKALAHAGTVAALLRLSWMASQKRVAFWREHPADVYVLPKRPSFTGKGTDACDYAWFVWGPGRGGRWRVLDLQEAA